MILQELLRNIVLYKGVIKPVLRSWTESLLDIYLQENAHNAFSGAVLSSSEAEISWFTVEGLRLQSLFTSEFSLADRTGTRTPSHFRKISGERVRASTVNIFMLMDDLVEKHTVIASKTDTSSLMARVDSSPADRLYTRHVTTGLIHNETYSFLSLETHEKREYLGEFSLTHEETPLLYFQKGGEQHDIDQRPVTAII